MNTYTQCTRIACVAGVARLGSPAVPTAPVSAVRSWLSLSLSCSLFLVLSLSLCVYFTPRACNQPLQRIRSTEPDFSCFCARFLVLCDDGGQYPWPSIPMSFGFGFGTLQCAIANMAFFQLIFQQAYSTQTFENHLHVTRNVNTPLLISCILDI